MCAAGTDTQRVNIDVCVCVWKLTGCRIDNTVSVNTSVFYYTEDGSLASSALILTYMFSIEFESMEFKYCTSLYGTIYIIMF